MSVSPSFQTLVLDQLSRAAPGLRTRRMFGAVGIYSDDLFFALIDDDTLYFKTDDATRAAFVSRGMAPFHPFGDERASMHYHQLPADLLDEAEALRPWVEQAIGVARRAKGRPASRN